mmetsp:Transcript_97903/g.227020  ORF Transcript_97903/g.227020 Transcript_97903/m.227020 type:complete len:204 (+) Transcript_97903:765-1376(+)
MQRNRRMGGGRFCTAFGSSFLRQSCSRTCFTEIIGGRCSMSRLYASHLVRFRLSLTTWTIITTMTAPASRMSHPQAASGSGTRLPNLLKKPSVLRMKTATGEFCAVSTSLSPSTSSPLGKASASSFASSMKTGGGTSGTGGATGVGENLNPAMKAGGLRGALPLPPGPERRDALAAASTMSVKLLALGSLSSLAPVVLLKAAI